MEHEQSVPAFELGKDGEYPPTITFVQTDGAPQAFRYEDFRRIRYYPDDMLQLHFATAIVTLHGRNLLPLWRAIRARRVGLVRVTRAVPEMEQAGNAPHIDSISIADRAVKKQAEASPC
jgi:hypothetical protein